MALKSCDTVHVAKRCRELIPGLWTGDRESSGTSKSAIVQCFDFPRYGSYKIYGCLYVAVHSIGKAIILPDIIKLGEHLTHLL